MSDNIIIDFNKNNLHILNYSIPYEGILSYNELKNKLYYLENFPNWIPYLTSYYKEDWGFCLSYNQFKNLKDEKYKIKIDSELKQGFLTYGDLIIKGQSDKEILFSCYLCHPSMCNDSLSGVALAIYLVKYLLTIETYYTYRFVFIPETIGSITYLHYNINNMKKNIIGGYVLTCVGDDGDFTYLETRKQNQLVDKVTLHVLNNLQIKYKLRHFSTCGSDERQYNFPGIDLNIGSLMKTKYGEFNEYHTSADNLQFITYRGLQNSYNVYIKCIDILENNKIFTNTKLCEPRLGKYNLYSMIGGLMMYYIDGKNDIVDIANILKVSFWTILEGIKLLKLHNLIK